MESHLSLFYGLSFLTVVLAFAFAAYLYLWVKKQKTVNAKIQEVSALIKEGANTFMRREYKILAKFAAVAAVLILLFLPSPIWQGDPVPNISMAVAYIAGTVLSAIAGKIGILVATLSNGRAGRGRAEGAEARVPHRLPRRRGDGPAGRGLLAVRRGGRADAHG